MSGPIAGCYTIVILREHGPIRTDEHRPERLISYSQSLGR